MQDWPRLTSDDPVVASYQPDRQVIGTALGPVGAWLSPEHACRLAAELVRALAEHHTTNTRH